MEPVDITEIPISLRTTFIYYLQKHIFHVYCYNNSAPNLFKWLALVNNSFTF
jgi:hypothetical protein